MDHNHPLPQAGKVSSEGLSFYEKLQDTFSQYGFMPHGHCYLWKPLLVYMHVISDLLIGFAYLSISITLYTIVKKINISFNRIVLCFGLFIGACGVTHFMEVWNLWNADYWWGAWVKVITAIASVGTGIYLYRLRHVILQVAEATKLAEERRLDLEALTQNLEERIRERTEEYFNTEKLLKAITDNASSCLFMMDENGHPTFMNPSAMKLTGYTLAEIQDRPLNHSIHYMKEKSEPVDFSLRQNQEDKLIDKNGRIFPVSYSVAPLEKNGRITGAVLEFRDITIQKANEKALIDAVHARDEFLSIASHELKTPLTTLLIQSQLHKRFVMKGDEKAYNKERINQFTEQTEKISNRLNRIVDDMLDISRIRSGKLNLSKQEVDFMKITEEVLERMKTQFEQAGYERPLFQGTETRGYWDTLRIEQVVNNLLTNAIRYGEGKPVEVKVYTVGENARLEVKDHGIGIAKESQLKIFNRFERAVNANEVSGLGLGLFISEQIVVAHQGKIWVESELGQGATFIVELPLRRE